MGQSWSSEETEGLENAGVSYLTRSDADKLFTKACLSTFQPIELYSIKQQLSLDELRGSEIVTKDQLFALLASPKELPAKDVLFNCIKFFGKFPLLDDYETDEDEITSGAIIKAITLFSPDRREKIFVEGFEYLELLFLALCAAGFTDSEKATEKDPENTNRAKVKVVHKQNKVLWSRVPLVQTHDGYDLENLAIDASTLSSVLTFVLAISEIAIPGKSNDKLSKFDTEFQNWESYKRRAIILLRTFLPTVTRSQITGEIGYAHFHTIVQGTMRDVFAPLSCFLNSLLFFNSTNQSLKVSQDTTKIVNPYVLSQLATFLPAELVYGRMKKLYVASDAGFSMRSFQSKVFKWNAPTILFVSGTRIREGKNKRYESFREEFPNFRKTDPDAKQFPNDNDDGEKLTFGAYITQPWKISNKDCFGDSESMLFQISPHQSLFKARKVDSRYVYFNTNGGGIGFGDDEPLLKNNTKRYQPGNVSLTLDSSLEFAVFRHLGRGGTYHEGSMYEGDESLPEYEDRFSITDLEVWGCGTEKDLAEQAKQWEWEQKEALARQRVNVKNLGEERAFLEMAGLVGGHGASGGSM